LPWGAIDFINKPFDNFEVIQRIRNLLSFNNRQQMSASKLTDLHVMLSNSQEELAMLSLIDPVSGLPNRRAIVADIVGRFGEQRHVSALVLSIDGMDACEHMFGHVMAEMLYKSVVAKFERALQLEHASWGCGGGYRLVLVSESASVAELERCASMILNIIQQPHFIESQAMYISGRLGICVGEDIFNQAHELTRRGQLAIPSKESGAPYQIYNTELEVKLLRASAIRAALPVAIENDEFSLHYQPKVSLQDSAIKGVEALLRWNSATLGFVPPDEFIKVAETSGLIELLGEWVIQQAIQDLKVISQKIRTPDFTVAINVSSRQLMNPVFAQNLISTLDEQGVDFGMIEIEVTESLMINDMTNVMRQLSLLRGAGISIALDDFGTGYSSLSYLRKLPIDVLKIDSAFVMDIVNDIEAKSLIKSIINLAKIFDFAIVAEGIEDDVQAATLARMGCHVGQGYFYARPMSLQDLLKPLERANPFLVQFNQAGGMMQFY
jgi:EAL domain-containing protein (putative c-di-GMP-specific phosphodiesterase class I)/GGDEF domain-containing protein